MLSEFKSQFMETENMVNEMTEFYLQKVLLIDEEVIYTFQGCGCFSFFTDRRIIFIQDFMAPTYSDEIEFMPYSTIERYGVVFESDGDGSNVELYIPDVVMIRFYFSKCEDAFNLVEFLGKKTQ